MRTPLVLTLLVAFSAPAPAAAASVTQVQLRAPDTVNIAGDGQLAVTVLSTASVDATGIDPDSIRLNGDRNTVARWADKQPLATVTDANGDKRTDVTLFFDKPALRATGALTATTTALTLHGRLPDGRDITGTAKVATAVVLEVKFRPGSGPTAAKSIMDRHRAADVEPLLPASTLAALAGKSVTTEMASWYQVTLPADADVGTAVSDLASVATAYPAPEPAPPPATPDFTSMQGYQRPAPQGVDADHARQDPRSRGAGIRIVDLEYDWNPFHEDLRLDWSSDLGGTRFPRNTSFADEHGTAVFGELVADDNAFGVTGGVPDAQMFGISPMQRLSSGQVTYRPAAALSHLATILSPGDVVLIEQQTSGPNGGTRYVPAEWVQSVFDATSLLTRHGVIVVATGGNGGENLDAPEFQGRFNRSVRDSGSIIVGAGASTNRSRLSFSVYGSRVDLQGWGNNITTTGSNGNLQGGTSAANRNVRYTRSFGGTSGAGPIVTGAVVAVQSYLKATGRPLWTARQMGDLFKATGTPQGGDVSQRIGPLPDLRAALAAV